jgi:hypothetical protein
MGAIKEYISKLDERHSGRLKKRGNLIEGDRGGGEGEGAQSYIGDIKPGPLNYIKYSLTLPDDCRNHNGVCSFLLTSFLRTDLVFVQYAQCGSMFGNVFLALFGRLKIQMKNS